MARIIKRTGKNGDIAYLIRVSCGYDAAGKQITKSTTWHPPAGMAGRQAEREAERAAFEFERSVRGAGAENLTNIKLCDFCQDYMEMKRPLLSPTVYIDYQRVINELILPTLGHMRVRDIRPVHVQRFVGVLQNTPRRGKSGQPLSASSVHRYFTVLKSIMAAAYKLGYTDTNPTASARLTLPPVDEPEVAVFTEDECAQLLEALEDEPLMWRLFINLAVVTGARRGELCAFRWENIDLRRQSIRIVASNYRLSGGEVQTKTPKTKKSVRTVTFDEYCAVLLRKWREEQEAARNRMEDAWQEGGWVFTRADGSPVVPVSTSEWFEHFQKRHGIPHHKFHSLRHTSGTLLLLRGTNIKTVASRLGHTQLTTVNRYVHALEQADIAAAASFDALRRDKKLTAAAEAEKSAG